MRVSAILLFFVTSCVGCSPAAKISLGSQTEYLPSPYFVVQDLEQENARPRYSRVAVYELADGCRVPECPLMWNVAVSPRQSPGELHYGKNLGLGTITLTPPKQLRPDREYKMVLVRYQYEPKRREGELTFRVDEHGQIIAPGMEMIIPEEKPVAEGL